MASIFKTNGLNLGIYDPPWRGGNFIRTYNEAVSGYSHTMAAIGGFLTCDFSIDDQPYTNLEDWVENGLGREVKIKTGSGEKVFEGFIDQLEFSVEGFHVTYGPMMDIGNKVVLMFSTIDWSSGSAVTGIRGISNEVNDISSQNKYGILNKILSTGGIQLDLVDELTQLATKKISKPSKSEELSFSKTSSTFSIRVSVKGWGAFLEKFPYNNNSYGQVNISDKIAAIIAAEPNHLFSSGGIALNTLQNSQYENDNSIAWSILKGMMAYGDANFNRYILGTYEDRKVVYQKVEDEFKYYRPLKENLTSVLDSQGNTIDPWLVRPGNWVKIMDLMPTAKFENDFDGLNSMFIESLSFKEPGSLSLNGSSAFKLEQRLAQLGISGIGI